MNKTYQKLEGLCRDLNMLLRRPLDPWAVGNICILTDVAPADKTRYTVGEVQHKGIIYHPFSDATMKPRECERVLRAAIKGIGMLIEQQNKEAKV